ncbi:MAG: winged helix-turn-helix transcriptional regulator [Theionarchaea archaeon]|nr:winged helix-turn-helix transcriptional regulator [Theionarchaea archaeon]
MKDEKDIEKMKIQEAFFKMLGSKAAVRILQYLGTEERVKYKDLQQFVNTHTLNVRIKDLLNHGLIEHHLTREEIRQEWYELTEKGKNVIELLNKLIETMEY